MLLVCVPLALIYAALLTVDFIQLRGRSYEQMEKIILLLAKEQAASFDGQFQALSQTTDATATFLTHHPDITDQQIEKILSANLRSHPLAFGAGIAFEPDGPRSASAPYIRRSTDEKDKKDKDDKGVLVATDLAQSAYDYTDAKWQWYHQPRQSKKPIWTQPYKNQGDGDQKICTYSAPFFDEDEKFRGVVYMSIRLEDLQKAVVGLKGDLGQIVDGFAILDSTGTFVSYPRTEVIDKTVFEMANEMSLPELADAGRDALAGKSGVVRIKGMSEANPYLKDDKYTWVAFAPIASNDWVFAVALPEKLVMAPLIKRLWGGIGFMTMGLLLIIIVVLIVASRICKPIEQLAVAVKALAEGDLETQVSHTKSRDEIGQLARGFNHMVERLKKQIDALTKETAAREKVESELRVGREIQTSLLPSKFPPFPEYSEFDIYAINVAARLVAGDFFDFFMTRKNQLTFLIADVSGKGVPAALYMAVARTVIRNLAVLGLEPAEILNRANTILGEDNPNSMFVTLFLGQYDTNTGQICYANAGHPPPYVFGGGQTDVAEFGQVTGPLLGVLDASQFKPYKQHTEQLLPDQSLLMYTDGVIEARSPEGKLFGSKRLIKLLKHYADASVDKMCKSTVAVVDRFQNNDRADDITILMLHRNH